jgi:citrate (Re)-synthase
LKPCSWNTSRLRGTSDGIDTTVITDIAQYFERELHYRIPPNYPFVGASFNATSAGIHADGMQKFEEIYNPFDTTKILKRPPTITITDKSGKAGIVHWVNSRLGLAGDGQVDKGHPGVVKIHKRIMEMYEEGRVTSISNDEMENLARKYLSEFFVSEFDRLKQKAHNWRPTWPWTWPSRRTSAPCSRNAWSPSCSGPWRRTPLFSSCTSPTPRAARSPATSPTSCIGPNSRPWAWRRTFSNRDWFIEPMKTGKVYVSDFYTSRFTGALCITVSVPIRDDNDEIQGVLGLDIRFEDMAKMEQDGEI